jgi:hypothetical protein
MISLDKWQLKYVFLPHSIRSIGESTFSLCRHLCFVHFGFQCSVWQLRPKTFSQCNSLRAIRIPAAVRQIHNGVFQSYQNLFSVTFELPSNCGHIASEAFDRCPLLKSIVLPHSVEVIDPTLSSMTPSHVLHYSAPESSHFCVENDCFISSNGRQFIQYQVVSSTFSVGGKITLLSAGSFMRNASLQTLVFGAQSRLKSLPAFCLFKCISLRSLHVPKSVGVICEHCFNGCSELAEVTFGSPATVQAIGSQSFAKCRNLTSFIVPSSVSSLGVGVFHGCSELSQVTFEAPSLLTNIPGGLFSDCGKLEELNLPDSVTTIADTAFEGSGVTSLTGVDCAICNSLLIHPGTILRRFGSPSKIVIPSSVREIEESQFAFVSSLSDLRFEEGVVSIGNSAFEHCTHLRTVAFPASLEVIGESAFLWC